MSLTDKQIGLINWRLRREIEAMGLDCGKFEKWAKDNMETGTLNDLIQAIDRYEDAWEEKEMEYFRGQINHLYKEV